MPAKVVAAGRARCAGREGGHKRPRSTVQVGGEVRASSRFASPATSSVDLRYHLSATHHPPTHARLPHRAFTMAGVSPPACPAMLFVPSTDASIAARFLLLQASFLGLPDDRTSSANTCASSLFKRNTIFLTTVFVSAFGVQLYVYRGNWVRDTKGSG